MTKYDIVMHAKSILHINLCQLHSIPRFACKRCSYVGFVLFCMLLIYLREVYSVYTHFSQNFNRNLMVISIICKSDLYERLSLVVLYETHSLIMRAKGGI
jgi:hypothetical protein